MWALLTLIVAYVVIIVFLDAFKRSLSQAGITTTCGGNNYKANKHTPNM
ncbi:MAG: hypothetical protein F7B19_01855 [Desulfurococcales archaeon]|nr:hypothetical protein [Desulfurococcales archaeon]